MVIGVAQVTLMIHSSFSLKEKRSVLQQIKLRTANKFNVSIAEVAEQDMVNKAVLGLAVVGSDRRHMNSMLDTILLFIENLHLAEVVASDFEIVNY